MIDAAIIDKVRQMLREGCFSQRAIAKETGVSRGTVNAIFLGRRNVTRKRRRNASDGFVPPSGRLMRCPTCGGLVKMPCLYCYFRFTR